ncbi:MAG: nitroreductase family protein [bacterium]|nr:nitroreductase family protein [bacterium]
MLTTIKTRRSVRQYKEIIPKNADIKKILEAGRWAPSGLNNQPWRFLIVKNKGVINAISEFTKYSKVIKGAPVLILVFLDLKASYNRDKDLMAIGASIQNMLLMAHSLKLGACWLGEILNKKEDVRKFLKLDKNLELMAVISLGYPVKKKLKSNRKPLQALLINSALPLF